MGCGELWYHNLNFWNLWWVVVSCGGLWRVVVSCGELCYARINGAWWIVAFCNTRDEEQGKGVWLTIMEKRALDREVLSTKSAKGEHESNLGHDG